jgi:hypothetical protein
MVKPKSFWEAVLGAEALPSQKESLTYLEEEAK